MMNLSFITKNRFLIFSIIATAIFIFLVFLGTVTCYRNEFCNILRNSILNDNLFFTIIFPGFLVISLTTYFLKEMVFARWKKFAIWAVPLTVILSILITKWEGTGGSGVGVYTLDLRPLLLIILYGWFFIHSFVIILATAIRERRNK